MTAGRGGYGLADALVHDCACLVVRRFQPERIRRRCASDFAQPAAWRSLRVQRVQNADQLGDGCHLLFRTQRAGRVGLRGGGQGTAAVGARGEV